MVLRKKGRKADFVLAKDVSDGSSYFDSFKMRMI
jgi:hypothetical protein